MESQTDITYNWSQEEMPQPKRQRRGSKQYRRYGSVVKVPKAIQTRGTPNGYYEIPFRQLFRLYGNTSTGLWNTNQTTGAAVGATGYQGVAYNAQLDNSNLYFGSGGISATITTPVADFASVQNLFDLCKISQIEVEFWITNPAREQNSTALGVGSIEMYVCADYNEAVPPSTLAQVIDRSTVLRVSPDGRKYKMSFKPYQVLDASNNAGEISGSTVSLAQPATYCRTDRPAVSHYGFKIYVPTLPDYDNRLYMLNILITQKRRYKMNQ